MYVSAAQSASRNTISIVKNGRKYSVLINNELVLEFERKEKLNFTDLLWYQGAVYAIENFTIQDND